MVHVGDCRAMECVKGLRLGVEGWHLYRLQAAASVSHPPYLCLRPASSDLHLVSKAAFPIPLAEQDGELGSGT